MNSHKFATSRSSQVQFGAPTELCVENGQSGDMSPQTPHVATQFPGGATQQTPQVKYSREQLLTLRPPRPTPEKSRMTALVKKLTHQEMIVAMQKLEITPGVYAEEMKRRHQAKQQRKTLRVVHEAVMTTGKHNVNVIPVSLELESTELAEIVLNFPLDLNEIKMVMDHYSIGRPWWKNKMAFYLKVLPEEELTLRFNSCLYSPYKKGTVGYVADLLWGSRRLRDKFMDTMEFVEGDAFTQADEPVLEEEATIAGNANITFVEEREVDNDASHIGASTSASDMHCNMAETPWGPIAKVLEREVVVFQGSWTETNYGEIASFGIPKLITDKLSSMTRSQLQLFAFLRAGVEIRVQFNGNRFAAGTLLFCILPPMFEEDADNYVWEQGFNWPHIRIDASASNVGTLFVPFTHILSHFPQTSGSLESDSIVTLGRLVIYCINKLQVGEGASNVLRYTVYARFVNPEIHQTTWPIQEFSYSSGLITQGEEQLEAVTQAAEEGLFKKIIGGSLTTALGSFLSKMTGGLATGLGSMLAGLIFDYPHDPTPALPIINTAVGPVCYGAGVDHSIRLSLSPVSQTETPSSLLGSTNGDFNIRTLLQIPSLLMTNQWHERDLPGALLLRVPVCPMYLPPERVATEQGGTCIYTPTLQAYISRAFCYWRGGMKLKLQFIKTEYNNGRVMVVYTPHYCSGLKMPVVSEHDAVDVFGQANVVIVDIEEQKEVVVDLPYMSPRPWLRCDAFRTDKSVFGRAEQPDEVTTKLAESISGYVHVFVLNSLVSPSNVPQDIDINFFIYCAEDFDLAYPTSLHPLNVRSFGQGSFGSYEDYPYVIGKKTEIYDVEFTNKEWIKSLYYAGLRLWLADRLDLSADPRQYWYNAEPTAWQGTADDETIAWVYQASIAATYAQTQGQSPTQLIFMQSLPKWPSKTPAPQAITQGIEEYTTNRVKEPATITSTSGRRACEVAPSTISENGMNMQTLLRRFYNIYTSFPMYALGGYSCISVPVNPTVVPIIRYPVTINGEHKYGEALPVDQVAWFSKLYTYWRGSLRYKFVYDTSMFDVIAIHVPTECRDFNIRNGVKEVDIQRLMAFGSAIGVSHVQGSLEVEVPYASPYEQLFIDVHNKYYDLRCQNGTLMFFYRNKSAVDPKLITPTSFSLFRSTGEDFVLNLFKAPPKVEEPQVQYGYCQSAPMKPISIASPEGARNLGNDSQKIALPGSTGIKKINYLGHMRQCKVDPKGAVTQGDEGAVAQMWNGWKTTSETVSEASRQVSKLIASGEVQDLLKNSSEAAKNVSELAAEMKTITSDESLKNSMASLNSISRKIDDLLTKTQSTASLLTADSDTVQKYACIASEVILCGTFVHHLRQSLVDPSLSNLITLGIELGLIVGLTVSETLQTLLMRVVDWALNFPIKKPAQAQAQALDEVTDLIDENCGTVCGVVAVIGTVLYAYIFGALPSFDKIKQSIKKFFEDEEEDSKTQGSESFLAGSLKNAHFSLLGISALEKVYAKILGWAEKFIFWILDKENPEVMLARTTCTLRDRVLKVLEELDDLEYEPNFIAALEDPLVHNRFYKMQAEVHELTRECTKSKVDQKVVALLTECRRRAQILIKRIEKEDYSALNRYDPFVVCLHGETGVGKTKFAEKIFEIYREVMDLPEHHLVYPKSIKDDYWSGYTNQPIIMWDEYGQSRDADKVAVPEFMALRGNKPVKVNMAALEDKGRDFTSQGIVLTTNVPYAKFNTIRDNEAHNRRRHVMIGMQHKANFDANVLQEARHDQYPNWEHCAFAITDNMAFKIIRADMSMEAVLDYVRERMTAWHTEQVASLRAAKMPSLPRGIIPIAPPLSDIPDGEWDYEEEEFELASELSFPDDEDETVRPPVQTLLHLRAEHVIEREPEVEPREIEVEPVIPVEQIAVVENEAQPELPGTVQGFEEHFTRFFKIDDSIDLTEDEKFEIDLFVARVELMSVNQLKRLVARFARKTKVQMSRLRALAIKTFDSLISKIKNFWKEHPKFCKVLGVLTLLGGVGAIMHFRDKTLPESYESGPSRPQPRRVIVEGGGTYSSGPSHNQKVRVVTEGSEDPQAMEIMRKTSNYVYPIAWSENCERSAKLNCVHIGGHVILVPFHFFNHAKNGETFNVNHRIHPVMVEYQEERLFRCGDRDWCLYNCGVRLEPAKNLVKYFIDEKHLNKIKLASCILITRDRDSGDVVRDSGHVTPRQEFKYSCPKYGDTYVQKGWKHDLHTTVGQCGGPLIICNTALPSPGKIGGIHVAGFRDQSSGFCVLITKQMLEVGMNHFNPQPSNPSWPQCLEVGITDSLRIMPDGDFTIVGKMPDKMSPAQPLKSTFSETPFIAEAEAELGPRVKKPAILRQFINSEGERVSPLKNALAKYGHFTKPFPLRNVKKVRNYFVHMFDQKLKHHTGKRVFSIKEAVNGLPGVEFAEKMNMKSSAGWPYQVEDRRPGKWHLFDVEGNIIDSSVANRLEERREAAKKLERVPSIWRDCMKDELRPVAKVDAGKTRLFTIAPVDFTILTRQMCLDFVMAFYGAHREEFFSAVGINPESAEWTLLYEYLTEFNTNVIAGDYECFDGKVMPELIMLVCDIINAWYGDSEENCKIRETLFLEIIHTTQVCENCVYMTHQGNPSGNPLTTVINTIVNVALLVLSWLEIYPDKTVDDFFQNVRVKAYGDDNLVAVKEPMLVKFNQNTIAQTLAKHNIVYTSETKTGDKVPDSRPILEVSFLKRGFRRDPDFGSTFVLPIMAQETLNSYFYYYRSSTDIQAQLQENQRSALLFAAFYGKSFYNNYLNLWKNFMRGSGLESLQISFEEQIDCFHYHAGIIDSKPRIRPGTDLDLTMTEGMEGFMKITNSKPVRLVSGAIEAPFYYLAASLGCMAKDSGPEPTDDRWAVAIPSGEGKSTLAREYPWLFVDHDDLILPLFAKEKRSLPWFNSKVRELDFPSEDRRVLLVHHPNNTNRRLVGSFITPVPTFIRMNCIQRLQLKNPTKLSLSERNILLVQLCSSLEPTLNARRTFSTPSGAACLNWPSVAEFSVE